MKELTDAEAEKIAQRVVALLVERLTGAPVPVSPPEQKPPEKPINAVQTRLAYTVAELAQELGLSHASIYRLENRGLLKAVPGIRKKLFSHKEVEVFLGGNQGGWKRAK